MIDQYTTKIQTVLPVWIFSQDLIDLTKQAIPSIKKCKTNLFIVDNGGTMGGGYLREQADTYIRFPTNRGYAPAMNAGMKLTVSEHIAITENDVRVSDNIYNVGEEILDSEKDVGSVHFRMIPYEEPFSFGNDVWKTSKERWCSISFCIFRREALKDGFFDEGYINANYEDWDIIHRIRHINGWKTAYTNRACYQHNDSYTQKLLDQTVRNNEAAMNKHYFKEKFGKYPEEIWNELYPEQMEESWRPFP